MTTETNGQLQTLVERIERVETEQKELADDKRDIYGEAKANGFDVKALRAIIRLRKQDVNERNEHQAIVETYMHALGMLATTDLGQAAIRRKQKELAEEGNTILGGLERTSA